MTGGGVQTAPRVLAAVSRPGGRWGAPSWSVRRRASESLAFAMPTVLCGTSWLNGGLPWLTDIGFVVLAALCGLSLVREVASYDERRSVGRIVLHGGVLIWFCQDYFDNWFEHDFARDFEFSAQLIARVATMHCAFVMGMVVGADWMKRSSWANRLVRGVPEPRSRGTYFALAVALSLIGLVPYVFFSRDPFWEAIYRSMTGFYAGGPRFTFGRTGNLNFDWSGYLFELIKIGKFGGLLGGFVAFFLGGPPTQRAIALGIWSFWTLLAFGSGTRGELVAMTMPVVVLMFLRYHAVAARYARRLGRRIPLGVVGLSAIVFAGIQVQGHLRSRGLSSESIRTVDLTELRGNHMFSEGLAGWEQIPARRPPFYDDPPGMGVVRAVPELAFRIAIHPIPRALWPDKPVDRVWAWHNALTVGTGVEGTTVSTGLVGWWYFRYGPLGMLEGALVVGFLFAAIDRLVQAAIAAHRPMALIISMGLLAWLFRCFRDVAVGELWNVLLVAIVVILGLKLVGSR